MTFSVYVVEEYGGDYCDPDYKNFVGVYFTKKQAKRAVKQHHAEFVKLGEIEDIDGYFVTAMDVLFRGFQSVYATDIIDVSRVEGY